MLDLHRRVNAPTRRRRVSLVVAAWAALAAGCSPWLFSGYYRIDKSRPVALIETTGGIEFAATTEFGILTLGRSATTGPCRVHYFLGPTPIIEDGTIEPTGSVFWRAQMDLKTQHLRVLDHTPTDEEPLLAMWTPDGTDTTTVDVAMAKGDDVQGDVLTDPGTPLPPGAAVFARRDGELLFVGLVSGRATKTGQGGSTTYYTFAGVDRLRELLAVPELHPADVRTNFRPDDIKVTRRMK